MDALCRGSAPAAAWYLSGCSCDWVNTATALCSMYIAVMVIGYLRWTLSESERAATGRHFRGHDARAVAALLLFLVHLVELSESVLSGGSPSSLISLPSASLAFWVPAVLLEHLLETSVRPRYLLVTALLWSVNGVARLVRFSLYLHLGLAWDSLRITTAAAACLLYLLIAASEFCVVKSEIRRSQGPLEGPGKGYRHDAAHFLSKMTFHWLTPLLRTGYSIPLEMADLGRLPEPHTTKIQFTELSAILRERKPGGEPPSELDLWRCFWLFVRADFCLGGVMKLLGDLTGLIGPLGISVIVGFASRAGGPAGEPPLHPTVGDFLGNGWCVAVVVLVGALAQSTFSQASTHLVNVRAIHLKAAIQTLIYTKSLTLRGRSSEGPEGRGEAEGAESDTGNIAHLMSEDAFNIMSFFWAGHYIWAIPLKISLLMYLLYLKLGVSAIIGAAATILTLTPLQFYIGKKMSRNASAVSEKCDERLQQINTLLQGIKLLKMLAWEGHCCKKILDIRKEETKLLDQDSLYWAVLTFFTHASSILVTLVTFGTHSFLQDDPLTPEAVFSALALFNQLTVPLFIFPVTVPIIISAIVSTRRLSEYLAHTQPRGEASAPSEGRPEAPEAPEEDSADQQPPQTYFVDVESWVMQDASRTSPTDDNSGEAEEGAAIRIQDGRFSWTEADAPAALAVKHLAVPHGKLTMVVGKVGSGKTSLLSAILGEMRQSSGDISWRRNSIVAYAAQTPWLLNATVRDNILFGHSFRPKRYLQVLSACALQPDMDILPDKDLTEIGERGINLSGGQKQRIAVARVLYSKANLVILDDPLSSLDYAVAMQVFEKGVKRLVRRGKRTVILVTHHIQLLAHAHKIIAMEDGRIRVQGHLDEMDSKDREVIQGWREMMSAADMTELQGKTAKERWQLVKLVARIGREFRAGPDCGWQAQGPTVMPLTSSSLRRRFQKFSKWKYMTHDLPLPMDECEGDVLEARAHWRKTSSVKRRTFLRATSFQHRNVKVATVFRQHSSPLIRPHGTGSQRGLLRQLLSSRHSNSSSESIALETPGKRPVERLLSTESGFSDASSVADPDEWDDLECQLGGKPTEDREYGQIPGSVYCVYLRTCGWAVAAFYVGVTLAWQVVRVATDFWLSKWTGTDPGQEAMVHYLYVYGILSLGSVGLSFASHGVGQCAGARARMALHNAMLVNIVRCPLRLFEATPAGRMFNRFSTDVSLIDKKTSTSIQRLMQFLLLCSSAILVNAAVAPWFLAVAIPVCLIYYIVQKFYRTSSRELQRLDSITRTPIFSHMSESLEGLATIRAFRYQDRFTSGFCTKVDTHTNAFLIMNSGDRWLGIVLDYLGGVIVFLAILTSLISAVLSPESVNPSLIGLAINYTLLVPIYLNWVVKFLADCEVYMGAVERVNQYSSLERENDPKLDVKVPETWPSSGAVRFESVSLSYGVGKERVVSGISLSVASGHRVGICGRSGSGKSSLALSLFNMVDIAEGRITLDGVDITTVPLRRLRSAISIIPQDVLLLNGTLRENLDPGGEHSDERLWDALDQARLRQVVQAHWQSLDGEVKDAGQSLSGGQRQLFCLARAILRGSCLLVMDEATSNLDLESELAVMATAKRAFQGKTLLIIAHRLSTIMDCDWTVVLDRGRIVEEGPPAKLASKTLGIFSTMLRTAEE